MSWSVSRDQLFQDCRRAYYYNYYGAWGGWESDALPATRKLYILKNLRTLPMWAGSTVHEVIAEALNRYARKNTPIRAGELQARAQQKLRAGWIEAVNREWLASPKKTNLSELYYGNGKTLPRETTEKTKDRVFESLRCFAESAVLQEILATPYMNWKPIDQLTSFVLDELKVWCAIDFAYVDPQGVLRILDWKTGSERTASLKVQLACYALYAAEAWHVPIDNVQLCGVFLGENARTTQFRASPEVIIEAKDRILTSAADMRAALADAQNNVAREDDLPCCEKDGVCRWCNFREVCPFMAGKAPGGNPE
ncbi:MAG: hypothetical protein A3K19_24145 [Lentisphaerae bacterium RIFOXYB12_FULL_65_16]|nr:MAG: hypothetical protein A3K18_27180 [Lentisphaerae bacterium RIFOXYA12_64_32]OGV87624.1 MAG: hypothetical protein A3K19_24145 [Lentisphaerae bacterium RIFOXYB12_FULL_65_16]